MTRTLKVPKEHQAYWPHSQSQFDKIPVIDGRLTKWKDLVETLYSFLYSVHSKETTILNEFGLLKKTLDTIKMGKKVAKKSATTDLADNDMTTLWQNFAVSGQKDHANWVAALNLLIQDVKKLRDEIKKRLKMYVQDTNTWANKIKKDRSQLLSAIDKQEKTKTASSTSSTASNSLTGGKDPWLSKRQIYFQIQDLTEKENQFQKRMCFLFDEVLKFDEHVVVELKRLFEKYSMEYGQYAQTVVGNCNLYRGRMNAVDPSAPFSTFCAAESLLQPELWRTERTISSFPYEIPDISIIKKGYLYRPGTLTKWKTSYFVLSSTGFLHCFDGAFPKNGTKLPTASANQLNGLGESDTTLTEDAQNGLNASECKTSLKYSIPLNQPRVQVQMLSGTKSNSPHAHSFEICVLPIPRSKDGFWSKLTREPVTHRWVIRAESEEDMVDWIVEIKKKIDSYVPERPPSPLFKLGDSRALSRSATQKSVVESPESLDSDGSLLDVPLEDSASIDVI